MAKRFQNQTEELIDTFRSGVTPAIRRLTHSISGQSRELVTSLDGTQLVGAVVEALGTPVYVSDVTQYAAYGITETGWYVFARLIASSDINVTASTTITGAAGYKMTVGEDHVDVAVRFDVAAASVSVTVRWAEGVEDVYIFKATDLAIRNLDYRTTFYVYDLAPYATWEYALTTDTAFTADKKYFTESGGVYTLAEVTASNPIPAYYRDHYALTTDETFADGKSYYILEGGVYTLATVTAGDAVTADTYYEHSYVQATGAFESGVTYYTLAESVYTPAEVTVGEPIPAYYNHSKIIINGLARNITYRLDEIVDCPMEFILPEIEDETHGCWFEMRFRHAGEYSMTLTPPSEDVKIATEHTQKETAGINMIDLHYTVIDGLKIWRFLNTHSSIPAEASA